MKQTLTHQNIFQAMEKIAPAKFAYEWDNVGMQIGNKQDETSGILVTLDVTEAVVDEAIHQGANLIIAHHPLFFQSIKQIDRSSQKGKVIEKIIKHDITVFAAHTNLDIASGGVNDMLCQELQIDKAKPLITTYKEKQYKVVVFVPESHVKTVLEQMGDAGAGNIGNYSHCAFMSDGIGTFKPDEHANPYVGINLKQHEESEKKIEVIVPENKLQQVTTKMIQAHPYEEPAYDILLLEQPGEKFGLGRIGVLNETCTVQTLCDQIKKQFDVSHVRVSGDLNTKVNKVAIVGGSGEKYVEAARKAGADVYITGDMTFHIAQDAEQAGLTVIDAGHIIEKIMIKYIHVYLSELFSDEHVIASTIDTNPFQYY